MFVQFHDRLESGETLTPNSDWAAQTGLNFAINSAPVQYNVPGILSRTKTVDNRKVLYRNDTGEAISVMSNNFHPVQPREVINLYRTLTEDTGMQMVDAGITPNNRLLWGIADLAQSTRIMGQDTLKGFLMFATANDGSAATRIFVTSYRPLCSNILHSLRSTQTEIRILHSSEFKISDVVERITAQTRDFQDLGTQAERLANTPIDNETAIRYFAKVLNVENNVGEQLENSNSRIRQLMAVYQGGKGQNVRSTEGTAWGLVNAVTRFTDHEVRSTSDAARFASSNFGRGAEVKRIAFANALEMVA